MTLDEQIEKVKKSSRPWERVKTSVDGIFIVKLPASQYRQEAIAVELNPAKEGKPTKKRGVFLLSKRELDEIRKILSQPKLDELMSVIDRVNPKYEKKEEVVVQM